MIPPVPNESPQDARRRHARVAERRRGVGLICHRGASEFAHQNTLEAYRATFELGGDGNEIDLRATRDGVLVLFHDDMLDQLLEAFGTVESTDWDTLRRFRFRSPGPFGAQCRIPTAVEVFELHRRHAGLIHLDVKQAGIDTAIADLLTRMEMWDHVAHCNPDHAAVLLADPRLVPRRYKAPGLYLDRSEVFPDVVADALKRPGDDLMTDDPRAVAHALGRPLGPLSRNPVVPRTPPRPPAIPRRSERDAVAALDDADDAARIADTPVAKAESARRIRARAEAAQSLGARRTLSPAAVDTLARRVRGRSLHADWIHHGLDGATALRVLLRHRAPGAVALARFVLWRDDPVLEQVIDPKWKTPRAWADWRLKATAWAALRDCPGADAEALCRDYLALSDDAARALGPETFEEAGRALLTLSPKAETAHELIGHRLRIVRGRAILDCLAHDDQAWARDALERDAPFARALRTQRPRTT